MGHILLIDDDNSLIDFLCLNLKSEGYTVEPIRNPDKINDTLLTGYHLVIVDSNGEPAKEIKLMKEIRATNRGANMGLVYCSEFGDELSLIDALDAGADDCVRKPFSLREFMARIRAIIRRRIIESDTDPTPHILHFKNLTIDTSLKTASIGRNNISLSNTEYAILVLLMQNIGAYTSRKDIFKAIWQTSPGSNERIVDTNISRLRRKLGDLSTNLINRPNKGYSLTE